MWQRFFCPKRELKILTTSLPTLVCNKLLFEREQGQKKETIRLACLDSIEAIRIDMDRFLESKCEINNTYLSENPNVALFESNTTTDDMGGYALVGTNHGQGTAQFLI